LAQSLIFCGTEEALDLADEAVELYRLGIVIVAAGLDGLFAISAHGVRRQPDHGNDASGVIGQAAGQRSAVRRQDGSGCESGRCRPERTQRQRTSSKIKMVISPWFHDSDGALTRTLAAVDDDEGAGAT
jgi:hypothetical protein